MSAPIDGYGQYPAEGQQQPPYPDQAYDDAAHPPADPAAAGAHQAHDHGKKKKRQYAANAFDIGVGGNAAVGGQVPAPAPYGVPAPATPGYGAGYPAQPDVPQQAMYGAPVQPAYGQQPAVAGYQAPDPYYPTPGAAPAPGGVAGMTAGFQSMNLGGQPGGIPQQQPQQLPPQARAGPLNQLYPTDLLNQPFNVSELDLPPPPIILPPNVSSPHP